MILNKESITNSKILPIFDTDAAIQSYSWRELIDIYVANNGHNPDEEKFRKMVYRLFNENLNNTIAEFNTIKTSIMEEIKND